MVLCCISKNRFRVACPHQRQKQPETYSLKTTEVPVLSIPMNYLNPIQLNMNKIFMVAFLFPPIGTVGSLRSYRFAKYFKEFNWAPTVLTVHDESCKYGENWDIGVKLAKDIRVNRVKGFYLDHIFKRMAHKSEKYRASINDKTTWTKNLWNGFSPVPDKYFISWLPYALKAALSLFRSESFDVIWTSSNPISSHILGALLKRLTGTPWIADFRDLWTQNHFWGDEFWGPRKYWCRKLEDMLLRHADALVTVSNELAVELYRGSDRLRHKTYIITNSYDDDELCRHIDYTDSRTGCLNFVYTGKLRERNQSPVLFFKAIKNLIDRGQIRKDEIMVSFYGYNVGWVADISKKYDIDSVVKIYGPVSRKVSLQMQKEASALLLIQGKHKGVVTGKIFEYLAAGRPILAIGESNSTLGNVIDCTQSGMISNNEKEIENKLNQWIEEIRDKGVIDFSPKNIESYSAMQKTRELVAICQIVK